MKYTLSAKAKVIDLMICDEIWSGSECSAKYVRDALSANPDATLIRVRFNSVGGDVAEGLDIYQALVDHPARVEGYVTGIAASIASVILCACDYVRIAEGGQVMIHNPYARAGGSADDLRSVADSLDNATKGLVAIYMARTNKSETDLVDMMAKETYLDSAAAVAAGFADEIVKAKTSSREIASLAFSKLRNPPRAFAQLYARAKGVKMDPQICEALGLGADASLEDVMKALVALKEAVKPPPAKDPAAPPADPPSPEDSGDEMAAAVASLDPKVQAKILGVYTKATTAVTARLDRIEKDRDDKELAELLTKVPATLQAWARKQKVAVVRDYVASLGDTPTKTEPNLRGTETSDEATEAQRAVARATGLPLAKIQEDTKNFGKGAK